VPRAYLGPIPHPAIGTRIPDIVIPPVLKAFKMRGVVGTLMLSYNRETAPSKTISEGKHILLGHTGTSIKEYISKASSYADEFGVLIEVEADHLSLMSSPERAIKRITHGGFEYGLSDEEIKNSLTYIEEELKEANEAGGIDFVTIDACELVDLSIDKIDEKDLLVRYENEVEESIRRELERKYLDRRFRFFLNNGKVFEIKFKLEDIARLSLKYLKSIEYVVKIYEMVKKYNKRKFGVEIALDELPQVIKLTELFFYMSELSNRGLTIDFIAPNIGFMKREDYNGDLSELAQRIDMLLAVTKSFGALLSFHSGSGSHPYSDKGIGVWETIRDSSNGMIKYKVSGVYIQLLLEIMSRFPKGSKVRTTYEEIFDKVLETVKNYVKSKKELYSQELESMINDYEVLISKSPEKRRDPRTDFFRHYFFLFQAITDEKGKRYLRDKVIELYNENNDLRNIYEREAIELTLRIIDKLGFKENYLRFLAR